MAPISRKLPVNDPQEVHRYIKDLNLTVSRLVAELFAGNYHAIFKGFGLEFAEIREYMDGDDIRMIDWNVFARTGQLHSKTFQEERELAMMIIVDCSASMLEANAYNSKFELQLLLFALFGAAAAMHHDRVGSLFFHKGVESFFPPRKGRRYMMKQLTALTAQLGEAQQHRGSDLALALGIAAQRMRKRGICIILSDFLNQGYEKELALLAHRHDVIAIRLSVEHHAQLPPTGLVRLKDFETHESNLFWGNSNQLRKRYRDFWTRQEEQWRIICRRSRVDYYKIQTNESVIQKIYEYLARRRRRGPSPRPRTGQP